MPYKDKEQQRAYQREWCQRRRAEHLAGESCVKCGSTDRLEIDHIEEHRKVSHRIWSWTDKRRQQELDKCQVLCHDCHQEKTSAYLSKKYQGENSVTAVLTATDVRNARVLYATGTVSYRFLAETYGVGITTIRNAIIGKTWSHLNEGSDDD